MDESKILNNYLKLFDGLTQLINETQKKTLSSTDEEYFLTNINFFTKSFIVLSCAYLESYLKDISMFVIDEMNSRLKNNPVPHNLVKWCLDKNSAFKKNDFKFQSLCLEINNDDIDQEISANIYRTITLFKKLGINLESNIKFHEYKDIMEAIVIKRNQIVHHNNDASDVSFADILVNIDTMKEYVCLVHGEVLIHVK